MSNPYWVSHKLPMQILDRILRRYRLGYRRLAEKLQIPFVDTDQLIEALEGDGILQIYETKGGEYFREVERRAIAE